MGVIETLGLVLGAERVSATSQQLGEQVRQAGGRRASSSPRPFIRDLPGAPWGSAHKATGRPP